MNEQHSHRHFDRAQLALFAMVGALVLAVAGVILAPKSVTPVHAQSSLGQGVLAVVGADGADLYDAPNGEVVGGSSLGSTLVATGRTADDAWVLVTTDAGESAWAEVDALVMFGLADLPIVEIVGTGRNPESTPAAETGDVATPVGDEEATDGAPEEAAATATPTRQATATPTATATPSPSPTPIPPTATPTPSPTPVPPTATPTSNTTAAYSRVIGVAGAGGTTLYDAPEGNAGADIGMGTALNLQGRTDDSTWLAVTTPGGASGWVVSSDVVAFNLEDLPVVEPDTVDMQEALADEAATDASLADTDMTPGATSTAVAEAEREDAATPSPTVDEEEAPPSPEPTMSPATPGTATPRPTPVVGDDDITAEVIVSGTRLNVRAGPGTSSPIVTKAYPGELFLAVGRNQAGDWIQIDVPDLDSGTGWVSANLVRLSDSLFGLPVTAETTSAAPTSTPAAEALPATEPSQTPIPEEESTQARTAAPRATQVADATGLRGKLAFQDGKGAIYLYDLASGNSRYLTAGYEPAISNDGTRVAFTRYGSEPGVYIVNTDGSDERRVFGERQFLSSPKWSPDDQWLVFSRDDGEYKCFNLGSFLGCQSERQFCPDVFPQCLPSDKRISLPEYALARIDLNGDNYRDLNVLNSARSPDWNGAGIVYDAARTLEVTQDKPDADTEQLLIGDWIQDPDWQPGGGRIIYQQREGSHHEIFAVNADGSGATALTRPVTTLVDNLPSNVSAAWSPDGQHIVYLSSRDENNDRGNWRIWVMNADGSNQRPLPVDVPIEYGFAQEQMVSWGR